jgi:TRAP-type mannitol/chloroaromatic compound transport system permease small subunit
MINVIDKFTDLLGKIISWLTVVMLLNVLIVVVARYFLGFGSIALQESVTYLHCAVFMLGLSYTLKHDGHVRVDILYRNYSNKNKAMVNFLGGLFFLVPLSILLFVTSWDYVLASWSIRETSAENNGLPFVYLLKSLMLVMPLTLLIQGLVEILRNGMFIFKPLVSVQGATQSNNESTI